jgi:hypothetical protein
MDDEELLRRLADVFERYDPVPVEIAVDAVRAGLASSPLVVEK